MKNSLILKSSRSLNALRNKDGIYNEHVSIVYSRRLDKINIEKKLSVGK